MSGESLKTDNTGTLCVRLDSVGRDCEGSAGSRFCFKREILQTLIFQHITLSELRPSTIQKCHL